jgi:formyl-CoA transferase
MPALDGMRVLDMTQYEAGTSCTQWLAWLGADVVKVEPPSGDPGRGVARGTDHAQYFMNYNGNKRSVVIDLKQPRGREVLLALAAHYDVFVENYGPGVIEAFDVGYDVMRARNPRIVYGRIKGFGLSGPYANYNSYDWVAQAAAGTFSVTGEPDGPPIHPAPTFADSGTGMQMALALTAAYHQQQRTGEGQLVELSNSRCRRPSRCSCARWARGRGAPRRWAAAACTTATRPPRRTRARAAARTTGCSSW